MKFYIRIVLLAAFLTSLLSAHAQSPTITWDSTVKDLGDSNYEVVFTGKILPGWHTYDLHSDVSSTLVEFEPATDARAASGSPIVISNPQSSGELQFSSSQERQLILPFNTAPSPVRVTF